MNVSRLIPAPSGVIGTLSRLVGAVDVQRPRWFPVRKTDEIHRKLVAFHLNGCPRMDQGEISTGVALSEQEEIARNILGQDFLSTGQVEQAYGFSYMENLRKTLAITVPSVEALRWARDEGRVVMPTLPYDYSLLQYLDFADILFPREIDKWLVRSFRSFSGVDTVQSCSWLTVRKEPYPDSLNKDLTQQQKLLGEEEYIPNVTELMYAIHTYYKVSGVCLLKNVSVRTSSKERSGQSVIVGDTDSNGRPMIRGSNLSDARNYDYVGVSSSAREI